MNEKEGKKLYWALLTGEQLEKTLCDVVFRDVEHNMMDDRSVPDLSHLLCVRLLEKLQDKRSESTIIYDEAWVEHRKQTFRCFGDRENLLEELDGLYGKVPTHQKDLYTALVTEKSLYNVLAMHTLAREANTDFFGCGVDLEHLLFVRLLEKITGKKLDMSIIYNENWQEYVRFQYVFSCFAKSGHSLEKFKFSRFPSSIYRRMEVKVF